MTLLRRRLLRVVLVLAGLLAAGMATLVGSWSDPAAAQPDELPEGCVRHTEDWSTSDSTTENLVIFVGRYRFLECKKAQGDMYTAANPGGKCVELFKGVRGAVLEYIMCLEDDDVRFLGCQNNIEFGIGENRSLTGKNDVGYAIIPKDRQKAPQWWIAEVKRENTADGSDLDPNPDPEDEDGDGTPDNPPADEQYLWGGQGCTVASNPPVTPPCAEIRDDLKRLRSSLGDIDETLEDEDLTGGDRRRVEENQSRVQSELDELEGRRTGFLIPDDCWGTFPSDHYTITYDTSDDELSDPSRLMGWLVGILFGITKLAVSAMLWLVRLAFSFDVTRFRDTVGEFAGDIDRNLVHFGDNDLSLFDFAWFALFAYAGFQALRGRIGRAGGEIAMAVGLAAVGVVLLGNFFPTGDGGEFRSTADTDAPAYRDGGYFDSVGDVLNKSAVALLRVGMDQDPNVEDEDVDREGIEELLEDSQGRLHREFIERPYLFIQYGDDTFDAEVEMPAPDEQGDQLDCNQAKLALLSVPDADGGWAKRMLKRAGDNCANAGPFNGSMNENRLMATAGVTIVAVIVSVLVGLAALTLLLSKFLVAVFFVALPLAVVAAILPGRSRQMAWGWATSLLQLWLAAMGMGLILALLMMGLEAIQATTEGDNFDGLAGRWVMILLLVTTLYILRKRIVSGSQGTAKAVAERLNSTGGGPSWAGAAAGGGSSSSVDLMAVDRAAARGAAMGARGAAVAGRLGWRTAMSAGRTFSATAIRPAWRLGRQRRQENRQAAKAQRWHWANLRGNQDIGHARQVLSGAALSKADASANLENAQVKEAMSHQPAMTAGRQASHGTAQLAQARHLDAAVANRDANRVMTALHRNRPMNQATLQSADRLGLSREALATGAHDPAVRNHLIRQADARATEMMDISNAVVAAGHARPVGRGAVDAVNRHEQQLNRSQQQQSHYDREIARLQGDDNFRQALLDNRPADMAQRHQFEMDNFGRNYMTHARAAETLGRS